MRILFITKPFKIEPLGIMYLSAAAKAAAHTVDIILTNENIMAKIEEFKPSVVAYSIMTGDQFYYNGINENIKSRYSHIVSIAGGPHPTFFPEMIDDPAMTFDAICIGEGEKAFVNFLQHMHSSKSFNFHFKNGLKNNQCPLIKELDTIEFPDRALVYKYWDIRKGYIKHFITSRGCPYNCTYCFNKSYADLYYGDKRLRRRSVDDVISEIQSVAKLDELKFVYFQDDTFILNKDWLQEFCIEYHKRVALPFHCHVRANLVTDEIVRALKNAGCYSVHMAAECGDVDIRTYLLKRPMSDDMIISACDKLHEYDIKLMLQNILGLPGTDLSVDFKTLELNIRCRPTYAWASIFQPYPKTALGEYCVTHGYYTGDFSDIGSSFFDTSVLNIKHKIELSNLQKLFAWAVQNPELLKCGALEKLIKTTDLAMQESYKSICDTTRKNADKLLYGTERL